MGARINRIALAGWRGIPYLEVQLDDGPLTALIGTPGAGKSTVAMLFCYALMPDRRTMDIKAISGVQDPHRAGVDQVAGRVEPLVGFAYVVLDMQDLKGNRVVAGLHVRVADARAEFTCLHWQDLPAQWPLQDCIRRIEGDDEIYPDLTDLGATLAQQGINLREMRSVREYGELLAQTGVLPTDYSDLSDRSLYARLVESTFQGGLSREVASKIKEYMLPAATRLPESIDRLQKCADTVLRTHSALAEAERQLNLLRATYGLARSIVSRAVASLLQRRVAAQARLLAAQHKITQQEEILASANASINQADEVLETAIATKQSVEAKFDADLNEITDRLPALKADEVSTAGEVKTAESQLRRFSEGRKAWKKCVGKELVDLRFSALDERLRGLLETNGRERVRAELKFEEKDQELRALEAGLVDSASAQLADALETESIAQALEHVDSDEARALELSLGGLVEGVVGGDLTQLASLKDDESFPHTFWLRNRLPEPEQVHQIGDWYASALAGGFVVASKRRRLALGRHSRNAAIERLRTECRALKTETLEPLGKAKGELEERLTALLEFKEVIEAFLAAPSSEQSLMEAIEAAKKAAVQAETAYKTMADRARTLNGSREAKVREVQGQIDALNDQKRGAATRAGDALLAIEQAQGQARAAAEESAEAEQMLERMSEMLGGSWQWLSSEAAQIAGMRTEEYIATQSRDLVSLGQALSDESAERLAFLRDLNVEDPLTLGAIWQPMLEIVGDRISVEGLEADGADLIGEMTNRRHTLSGQLDADRAQMRTEAKSLYSSIATEIRKQERRIRTLSAFGETLRFGNVTGMRIVAHHRTDLLEHLQNLAKQIDLFASGGDKPLDAHLAELFNKAIGSSYSGAELLDYRTYMDLTIEARRNGKWDLASGLSGGESIGGGLAFSLMLARSLAQRSSNGRLFEFTPTFVIDEVQRLDSEGQRLIVEFGRSENIQVFVTALSIEHKFPCTIYVMARHYNPVEQVVARRVLVKPKVADE